VIEQLASHHGQEAQDFLSAFFTSGTRRSHLARGLSRRPWTPIFTYLASDDGVPDDVRATLIDEALRVAEPTGRYELPPNVTRFLVEHYEAMPAFIEPLSAAELANVMSLLRRAHVSLPVLQGVHEELRERLVTERLYDLTADNLRVALGITGEVALDDARRRDAVYGYCLSSPMSYLDAVDVDEHTSWSVRSPRTLIDVLTRLAAEGASSDSIRRICATASKASKLDRLNEVPSSTWRALAEEALFRASLENLAAYRAAIGTIDPPLGRLLIAAEKVDTGAAVAEEDGPQQAEGDGAGAPDALAEAVALLNSREAIPATTDRVILVGSLCLEEPIMAGEVNAEASDLFALLIKHELVADDTTTFTHLSQAGWAAVKPAALASRNIVDFMSPDLLGGLVAEVLSDAPVADKLGKVIVDSLQDYVPTDDPQALRLAAQFAVEHSIRLPTAQIHRIAASVQEPLTTVELLRLADPEPPEIVEVLRNFGGPHGFVATWQEEEFEVPNDRAHEHVFRRLHEARMLHMRKKRGKPSFLITALRTCGGVRDTRV
jgi:hypothetical protein